MSEMYEKEINQLRQKINGLKAQIQREKSMTSRIKNDYKQEIEDLQNSVNNVKDEISITEKTSVKTNITKNQLIQRERDITQLTQTLNEMRNILGVSTVAQQKQALFENAGPVTFKKAYDKEGVDKEQIQKGIDDEKDKFNKRVDELNVNTIKIKDVGKKIGYEIENQIQKLDIISDQVEANTTKMLTTTQKMEKLINESSSCGILITIFIEIAVLVLILLYL